MIAEAQRPMGRSLLRGLKKRCPNCGEGAIFKRYLKATDNCDHCGESLSHIRTDDFAPWLTILVVGHIIAPILLEIERSYAPPLGILMSILIPLVIVLSLVLLPFAKGTCLGLMWALRMRGDEQH
ncbi:DUF983 domain-containing protein [Aestuariispira ectoiniformans]|uniref:DUF983 domain-containing protein n=1 Tax=Aestuariispira ectoiniformans TaxID=2775080 RepID=UPI00223B810A|nr:DUF983 domain-containing protein [Aestuariispira ectoiniformans]